MKFNVYMCAFMNSEIRIVDVPDSELGETVNEQLGKIFYYGQNDHQVISNRCSVSAGDVIEYRDSLYLVMGVGFLKISAQEFEKYKALPRNAKFSYYMRVENDMDAIRKV